jgi:hypothetical protein
MIPAPVRESSPAYRAPHENETHCTKWYDRLTQRTRLDPDSFDFAHAHVIVPPIIRAGVFAFECPAMRYGTSIRPAWRCALRGN